MNALIEFLNLWGARCLHSALPMLLQASLLIVVLFLLDLAFERHARAVVRYGLWLLVLVKLVLPPSLALPTGIGYWFDTRKQTPVKQTLPATTLLRFSEAIAVESEPKFSPPPAAPAVGFAAIGLLAWIAVSVILLVILISRSRTVARRVAEAAEAPAQLQELLNSCCRQMGMRQTTALKLSGFAMSPAACGLLRPVILIPEELVNQLSMPSLRAVLLHELAHIKRGDVWVNYLQTLLQIVYWYHPLLWLANAQIRRVREQAVDEMVMVELGEDAETYPATLLQVAKTCFVRARLSLGLVGIVESGSALAQRLRRLVNRPIPATSRLTMANVLLCLLAGAALLPMAHGQRKDKMLISATKVDPETIEGTVKIDVLPNGEYVFNGQKMLLDQLHSALHKEIHRFQQSLIFEIHLKGAVTQNDLDKLRERLRWLGIKEAAMVVGEPGKDTSRETTIARLQMKIGEIKHLLAERIRGGGNDYADVPKLRSFIAQLEATLKTVLTNGTRLEAQSQNARTVTITKDGRFYLGTQPVSLATLQQELEAAVGRDPRVAVSVRTDREVPLGMVIKVLDAARAANVSSPSLTTSPSLSISKPKVVTVDGKFLALSATAFQMIELGTPNSTDDNGISIWSLSPEQSNACLRRAEQQPGFQILGAPRIITIDGREAAAYIGQVTDGALSGGPEQFEESGGPNFSPNAIGYVNVLGQKGETLPASNPNLIGPALKVLPRVVDSAIDVVVNAQVTEAVLNDEHGNKRVTSAIRPEIRTNFLAEARVLISNRGTVVIANRNFKDAKGNNVLLLLSTTLSEADSSDGSPPD